MLLWWLGWGWRKCCRCLLGLGLRDFGCGLGLLLRGLRGGGDRLLGVLLSCWRRVGSLVVGGVCVFGSVMSSGMGSCCLRHHI